jgi:hypothetical protein
MRLPARRSLSETKTFLKLLDDSELERGFEIGQRAPAKIELPDGLDRLVAAAHGPSGAAISGRDEAISKA